MALASTDYMQTALDLARQAALRQEVPVGAVLVCQGEILGSAANRREEEGRATAHAEILALEDYSQRTGQWRLPPGTALYVTVEPCLMCTGALIWARVSEVYYGCPDPKQAGLRTLLPLIAGGGLDHRFERVEGGIHQEECAELISRFFRDRRAEKKAAATINS